MSRKKDRPVDLMAALQKSLTPDDCTCPWVDGVLRKGPHCPVHKHKREDR